MEGKSGRGCRLGQMKPVSRAPCLTTSIAEAAALLICLSICGDCKEVGGVRSRTGGPFRDKRSPAEGDFGHGSPIFLLAHIVRDGVGTDAVGGPVHMPPVRRT